MKKNTGRIIIDADGCPRNAKDISYSLAQKYGWEMIAVASYIHQQSGEYRHIVVGDESQAADLEIINLSCKDDIIITQDWGLAAVLIGKGAKVISPRGFIYEKDRIDFLLEERYIKAKVRRLGGRTKGQKARTKKDDERFRYCLENLILYCN